MESVLAIVYLTVFVGLVVALVRTAKRPTGKKWLYYYLTEIAALCAAYFLGWYFGSQPGAGVFAGLGYFAHTLYSLGAVVLYSVLLVVSVIVGGVVWLRRK